MPPPRPASAPTQQLIDLCIAVAAGDQARLPDLRSLAASRKQELTVAWDAFARTVEARDEAFATAHQPLVEAVETQFLAYSKRLDAIAAWRPGASPVPLTEAAEALGEISPALRTAQAALEAAELSQGPSRFPTVNLFDNMAKRLLAGDLPAERWSAACEAHRMFYAAARDEIDASPHAHERYVPESRAAFQSLVDLFERMQPMGPSTPTADFDAALEVMTSAQIELTSAVDAYNEHNLAETPTASPEANRIIHAAQGLADGLYRVEVLHSLAEAMQKRVRQLLGEMDAILKMTPESDVVAEASLCMLEAAEAMDDALATLVRERGPGAPLDEAVAALTSAVGRFHEANQRVTRSNETFGKPICPGCQAVNERNARVCKSCERPLPVFIDDDVHRELEQRPSGFVEGGATAAGARQTVTTGPMRELQRACERFERGEMSREDLLAVLQTTEEDVRFAEARLTQLSLPSIPDVATPQERAASRAFIDLGADGIDLLAEGVRQCRAGLATLREFADNRAAASMRRGLREFGNGTHSMFQIQKVADAFVALLPPIPGEDAAPMPGSVPGSYTRVAADDDDEEHTFGSL